MFRISLRESAILRVIANTDRSQRSAVIQRLKQHLRHDGQEIAEVLVIGVGTTAAHLAASEFEKAAKARPGW